MQPRLISGLGLLVIGLVLFFLGLNAKDSFSDRFSNFFTGHFTEYTMWLLILGLVAGVSGFLILISGGRRANT